MAIRMPFLATLFWVVLIVGVLIACLSLVYDASATTIDNIYNIVTWLAYFVLFAMAIVLIAWLAGLTVGTAGLYLFVIAAFTLIALLIAVFLKFADKIMGVMYGVGAVFKAIWENLKIAWNNMLSSMQYLFWRWVDSILDDFKPIIELINKVLEAMGEKTIDVNFAANKADKLSEKIGFVDIGAAYKTGYDKGSAIGKGIQDKVNGWGEKLKNPADEFTNLDTTAVGGDLGGNGTLDDIAGDTSRIADSMELTNEDLEYLRKIAAMEWKKEYTTANITVDMKNYNQIDGKNDLDGIVTQLSKKLYEELGEVANGVYA
jgi:ABC-type multidrug transport system fused ATPase/permease subunit